MATNLEAERLLASFVEHLERVPFEYRTDVIACIRIVGAMASVATPEDIASLTRQAGA